MALRASCDGRRAWYASPMSHTRIPQTSAAVPSSAWLVDCDRALALEADHAFQQATVSTARFALGVVVALVSLLLWTHASMNDLRQNAHAGMCVISR